MSSFGVIHAEFCIRILRNIMKQKRYAIVDIETTGGYAENHAITEIAIIIHNGQTVEDEFHTLINPGRLIPPKIQFLTGISNEMVEDAPYFNELAEELFQRMKECVFVAHNVNFDFSFLHHQFHHCGLNFNPEKLCTVRLSRKIFPGLHSYSLGNLCHSLQIPIHDRHRAFGDALATAKLFTKLVENDSDNLIGTYAKKKSRINRLPLHMDSQSFENLPESIGVYKFLDKQGKIIYIGKAKNIKRRIFQHFSGNNLGKRRQNFIQEIYSVIYFETGTEIMALLYECKWIKLHWPKYNRALKHFEPKYDLIQYQDQNQFMRLAIVKHSKYSQPLKTYERVYEATQDLLEMMKTFDLNPLYCHFYNQEKYGTFEINQLQLKFSSISPQSYNETVKTALEQKINLMQDYYIIDKGRNSEESAYIEVSQNRVVRFGYISHHLEVKNLNEYSNVKDLTEGNFYMFQLVEAYKMNNIQKVKMK